MDSKNKKSIIYKIFKYHFKDETIVISNDSIQNNLKSKIENIIVEEINNKEQIYIFTLLNNEEFKLKYPEECYIDSELSLDFSLIDKSKNKTNDLFIENKNKDMINLKNPKIINKIDNGLYFVIIGEEENNIKSIKKYNKFIGEVKNIETIKDISLKINQINTKINTKIDKIIERQFSKHYVKTKIIKNVKIHEYEDFILNLNKDLKTKIKKFLNENNFINSEKKIDMYLKNLNEDKINKYLYKNKDIYLESILVSL